MRREPRARNCRRRRPHRAGSDACAADRHPEFPPQPAAANWPSDRCNPPSARSAVARPPPRRIGPILGELGLAMLAAQQPHRIVQIGIQQPVMLDHRADRRIADQRRAQVPRPNRPPVRRSTSSSDTAASSRQLRGAVGEVQRRSDVGRGLRALGEQIEEPQPHAGVQDLRVDEARAHIEQRARAPSRRAARQRKCRRPALKSRIAQPSVSDGEVAIAQGHGGGPLGRRTRQFTR